MLLKHLLAKRTHAILPLLVVLAIVSVSVIPLVLMTANAPTPAPPVTFSKTFGGAASDEGWDVVQTNGGYVAVGYTGSFTSDNSRQAYIVKVDTTGDKVWEKTIGDSGNDYGVTIKPTSDGGFVITGWTDSYGRGDDVLLLKIDANGNKQWSQAFGGPLEDRGMGVVQTNDGGYAVCGWTYSAGTPDRAIWLIKTNSAGAMLWNKTFGGSDSDYGYGIVQSRDGGLVLTGAVASSPTAGDRDVVLIKTDAQGNEIFYKTYGGAKSDYGQDVVETSDGGFFITGWTWSFGAGDKDIYIIKTDAQGNKAWDKTFGGPYAEHGFSGKQTAEGGYIIVGDTIQESASGYEDVCVIKTDSAGSLLWNMTIGGPKCDIGYSIKQTSDGGYIIAGETHSYGAGSGDLYLVKLGSSPPTPALGVASTPAVCAQDANSLDVFVQGTDHALYHKHYQSGSGWSAWEPLGGILTSSPTAASSASGKMDVFVRGTDGALWQKEYNNGWGGWSYIGGQLAPGIGPGASSWGSGRLEVFVEGIDGALYQKEYNNGWGGWSYIGGM